jgi:hypothetical protein
MAGVRRSAGTAVAFGGLCGLFTLAFGCDPLAAIGAAGAVLAVWK